MKKRSRKSVKHTKLPIVLAVAGIALSVIMFWLSTFVFSPVRYIKSFLATYSDLAAEKGEVSFLPKGLPLDIEEKLRQLERDIKKVESSPFLSLSAETYSHIANFYFNYANINKSLESITKAISKRPNVPDFYFLRAVDYFYLGRFLEARTDLASAAQFGHKSGIEGKNVILGDFLNALMFYFEGDLSNAEAYLTKYVNGFAADPEHLPLQLLGCFFLDNVCFSQAEYVKSEKYFIESQALRKKLEQQTKKDDLAFLLLCITSEDIGVSKAYADIVNNLDPHNSFTKFLVYLYEASSALLKSDESYFKTAISKCYDLAEKNGFALFGHMLDLMFFDDRYLSTFGLNNDLIEKIRNSPIKFAAWEADANKTVGLRPVRLLFF